MFMPLDFMRCSKSMIVTMKKIDYLSPHERIIIEVKIMSRSYAMQDILNTIGSADSAKILREYPDFLITHWFKPPRDDYEVVAVIESPDGKRRNKIMTLSELAMTTCVRKPEKLQNLIDVLRKNSFKLVPSSEWRNKFLNKRNITILAEGAEYIAYKKHDDGIDKYYIEAPAYAKNAMEDSYPWSTTITKEQAMLFMNNYQLASAYYQKVRYNK